MLKKLFCFLALILLTVTAAAALAGSSYDEVYSKYPKSRYLVGVGEAARTGNTLSDKRIAEVLARLDIARQIKIRLQEETLDIMCEGGSGKLFKGRQECRNEFIMVVSVTVDEFLKGSRIVDYGEKEGIIYAVAVMPKTQAVEDLDTKIKESINNTKENIEKARKGDKEAVNDAQEEYMKAVTYDKEREMIDGVRDRASGIFDELENELLKLRNKEASAE